MDESNSSRPRRNRRPKQMNDKLNQNQPSEQSQNRSDRSFSRPQENEKPLYKQTNQQDRYARPSLSRHGARPYTPIERTPTAAPSRRFTSQSTPQRPQPGRNPRLDENRPVVRRPQVTTSASQSRTSANGQKNNGRLTRRRFSQPNAAQHNYQLSQENGETSNVTPVVLSSASRKLRIIPLGGAGETGAKNMTVFEYGEDILIIDCGIAFADKDLPGVDALIPDVTYLQERRGNIRGMVFTHGHEDHIGGVPYIWPKLNCPMYATPLAAGLIQHKLDEAGITNAPLTVVQAGDKVHFGKLSVEMVRLTHSIPDVLGLAIRCPAGLFFYATDWRLEHTPALGKPADWIRIAELGGEGITALFSDSTNVDRPGYSPTEKVIGEAFDRIFQEAKGRIVVAQFSSQINRIQQVLNSAKKFGRKVAISGRSMETYVNIAMNLGYLKVPEDMLIDLRKIDTIEPRKVTILSTGSQGEEHSSLTRMSEGEHRHIKLEKTDTVVISASPIPGNEGSVNTLLNNLYREGVNVVYNKVVSDIHVSGHPSRDELKMMFALTHPKYFLPIHGDYHRIYEHGKIAIEMGVDENNIILMENGNVVEFDERGGRITTERLQIEDVMIDGLGVGDIGSIVIRDRLAMGKEGMVTIFMVVKQKTGEMATSPDIISRGFVYMRESEELMHKLREEIKNSYTKSLERVGTNWEEIKQVMRDDISQFLSQNTGRNPMVIPVITTI